MAISVEAMKPERAWKFWVRDLVSNKVKKAQINSCSVTCGTFMLFKTHEKKQQTCFYDENVKLIATLSQILEKLKKMLIEVWSDYPNKDHLKSI